MHRTVSILTLAGAAFAGSLVAAQPAHAQTISAFPSTNECVDDLVAGSRHTCALTSAGKVRCWGDNGSGQLNVPSSKFKAVAVGGSFTCGIRTDGFVQCWGDTSYWNFPTPNVQFSQIDAGPSHVCGVDTASKVRCWGYSGYSRIVGTPTTSGWASASAGAQHSCGIKTNGARECWGYNQWWSGAAANTSDLDAGNGETCELRYNSNLGQDAIWCRARYFNQGTSANNATSWSTPYSDMSMYYAHVCGVRDNGQLDCWGYNYHGQTNAPAGTHYVRVAAGSTHSCALTSGNKVVCWGDNSKNQTSAPSFGYCFKPAGPGWTLDL